MSTIIKTKHPYVVKIKGVCGGRPIIKGTRIPVWMIAGWLKQGFTAERVKEEIYPDLSLAEIYDALSFYYENQEELDKDIAYNNPTKEEIARRTKRWKGLKSS